MRWWSTFWAQAEKEFWHLAVDEVVKKRVMIAHNGWGGEEEQWQLTTDEVVKRSGDSSQWMMWWRGGWGQTRWWRGVVTTHNV